MTLPEIIAWLEARRSETNLEGQRRFGINPVGGRGVGNTELRKLARQIRKSHPPVGELWASGAH